MCRIKQQFVQFFRTLSHLLTVPSLSWTSSSCYRHNTRCFEANAVAYTSFSSHHRWLEAAWNNLAPVRTLVELLCARVLLCVCSSPFYARRTLARVSTVLVILSAHPRARRLLGCGYALLIHWVPRAGTHPCYSQRASKHGGYPRT